MTYRDDPQARRANLAYIRDSMNVPMLGREEESFLATRWRDQQDESALHALIRPHERLAVSIASKFKAYGLPLGDLIQEGNLGLMIAAQRFDPERGVRFSTYAAWWIRSCIQDYVLRNWSIVRTGTTAAQKALFFNLRRLKRKIEASSEKSGLDPEDYETLSREMGISVRDIRDMDQRFSANDFSLNAPVADASSGDWQDLVPDKAPSPEEVVMETRDSKTRSDWLNDALASLDEREQTIVRKRHLEDSEEHVTLEDLGACLGISKERVRQLEKRAMDKLKTRVLKQAGENRSNLYW